MNRLRQATELLKDKEYLLVVDKSKHQITVYDKTRIVEKVGYPCSLGRRGWSTPKGLFKINIKYYKNNGLCEHSVKELEGHKLDDNFEKLYYNNFYFGLDWKGDKKRPVGWYPERDDPNKLKYVNLAIHGAIDESEIVKKKNSSSGCIWMKKQDIDKFIDKKYIAGGKDTWVLIR